MSKDQKLARVAPVPIQLVDEDFDDEETDNDIPEHASTTSPRKLNTWARDLHIGECTIVNGTNGQKFAVWSLSIDTAQGGHIRLLKRYSEFDKLRADLIRAFPDHVNEIPKLPPKKVFGNLNNDFLIKRRRGLEYFISCVLLNPVLGNSDIAKKFVSSSAQG